MCGRRVVTVAPAAGVAAAVAVAVAAAAAGFPSLPDSAESAPTEWQGSHRHSGALLPSLIMFICRCVCVCLRLCAHMIV